MIPLPLRDSECIRRAQAAADAGAVGVIFFSTDQSKPDRVFDMGPWLSDQPVPVSIPVTLVPFNEGARLKGLDPATVIEFKGARAC